MNNTKKVAIIIINYNSLDDAIECLTSLKKTDYPNFEIVVVDNASTVGSVDEIEKLFPDVILFRNKENIGFGKANNVSELQDLSYGSGSKCQP